MNFPHWTLLHTLYFSSYCMAAAFFYRAETVSIYSSITSLITPSFPYLFAILTDYLSPNFTENKVLYSLSLIFAWFPIGGRKCSMNIKSSSMKFHTESWEHSELNHAFIFLVPCIELKYLELLRFEWSYSSLGVLAIIKPAYLKQTVLAHSYAKSQGTPTLSFLVFVKIALVFSRQCSIIF